MSSQPASRTAPEDHQLRLHLRLPGCAASLKLNGSSVAYQASGTCSPGQRLRVSLVWRGADGDAARCGLVVRALRATSVPGGGSYLVRRAGDEHGHGKAWRVWASWSQSEQVCELGLEEEEEEEPEEMQTQVSLVVESEPEKRGHRLRLVALSGLHDQRQEQRQDTGQGTLEPFLLLSLVCLGHFHSISAGTCYCCRQSSSSSSSSPSTRSSSSSSSPPTSSSSSPSSSSACRQCHHLCSSSSSLASESKSPKRRSRFHCLSCSSSSSSGASCRRDSSCSSPEPVRRSRRRRRRQWIGRQNVQTQTSVDLGQQQQQQQQSTQLPVPVRVEAAERPSQRHLAPAHTPSSRNLLDPMDLVWRSLGAEARALSCTEASLSTETSSLVAQLKAGARSRSLCSGTEAAAAAAVRGTSSAGRPSTPLQLPRRLLSRVGKLTRSAIDQIRRLSTSTPAIVLQRRRTLEDDATGPSQKWSILRLSRRASSHRGINASSVHSGHSPAVVVTPHQLNRFASASATALASADARGQRNPDDLLYSPAGVYLGPGGVCSWRDVCARSASVNVAGSGPTAAANQRRRPQGGAGHSWLARSSVAQALRLGGGVATLAAPSSRTPLEDSNDQKQQRATTVIKLELEERELAACNESNENSLRRTETVKVEEKADNEPRLATFATTTPDSSGGASMWPSTAASQQASKPTPSSWLSSLTQRVHAGSGSPQASQWRRQRAAERRQRNQPKLFQQQQVGAKEGAGSSPPPYLSKEARSNSLSEGLQRGGRGVANRNRLDELSRSSMELAGGGDGGLQNSFVSSNSHLSQTIAEQTSMYLAELSSRFAGSSHDLQPMDAGRSNAAATAAVGSRRSSSDRLNNEMLGSTASVYGANLQTICVHCQLIAELASHPQSSYLSQLLPQPAHLSAAELLLAELDGDDQDEVEEGEEGQEEEMLLIARSKSLVKPSVVLTFCSNQTTIDQEDEDDEVEDECEFNDNEDEEVCAADHYSSSYGDYDEEEEEDDDDDDEEVGGSQDDDSTTEMFSSAASSSPASSGSLSSVNSLNLRQMRATKKTKKSKKNKRRRGKSKQQVKSPKSTGRRKGENRAAGGQSLEVPSNKQNRSVSLDAPYLLKVPQTQLEADFCTSSRANSPTLVAAAKSSRSRSVDISLPAKPGESYLATTSLQLAESSGSLVAKSKVDDGQKQHQRAAPVCAPNEEQFKQKTKFIQGEIKVACANGETRALKLFVNWEDNCINGEHLWIYVGSSSEACYVGESECLKHGPRLCCSACKIMAHTGCISILIDKIKFICKHTFKDLTLNNPRHVKELQQQNVIYHHWVHKRTHCGRCKQCTKTFGNTKLPFSSKEIQAITCSWCKVSYHNKENCYTLSALTEPCSLGAHRESIIPPTWILKLPNGAQHLPQQQSAAIEGANNSNTNMGDSDQFTTDASMLIATPQASQALDTVNLQPDSSEISKLQQAITNRSTQSYNLGSNTTLLTDTSGYMSTEGINSNVQALTINNNVKNQIRASNSENNYTNPTVEGSGEIVVDPSALQVSDLSMLNQTLSQPPVEKQLHPQENTNQYQKHQLRQYYRQIDASQVNDQAKFGHDDNNEQLDNTSIFMDLQLMQQQQNMQSSTRQVEASNSVYRNFRIVPKPIPGVTNAGSKPVLVFVNPRSGGNQGAKMMQKFNWLLNPRQVFDLIQAGGPRAALELYRDVPNLRILTIGGDGTASWILSYLDEIGIPNKIPVAVLPLGTGNDLARALGWGGGYADEPIAKILTQVRDGEIVQLDRWNLHVERNLDVTALNSPNEFLPSTYSTANTMELSSPSISSSPSYFGSLSQQTSNNNNTSSTISIIEQTNCDTSMNATSNNNNAMSQADEAGSDRLPMDVINNYFSFGVDAHIALEFHTAREAHPERFSSRLRNKMFYGQAGGKDLLKRKWKDLSNFVALYCDGQDMTGRLKELKVHSVLFLNIPSYSGGTRPWPNTATSNFAKPRTDDGLIEVIGLTTYQLPLLQAGGHGTCIAQCRRAKIITSRTIPMQVDGEPCKLLPSIINISFKNRVCMLAKAKSSNKNINMTTNNILQQKSN